MYPKNKAGKRPPLRFRTVVLFAAAALVAGCNSGGGSTVSTAPAAPAVAITQQNSPQAAGAAYQVVSTESSSSSTGSSALTGSVITGKGGWPNLARFARQEIAKLSSLGYATGSSLVTGGVTTQKAACDTPPGGGSPGTMSESFNDADNSGTLTTGDSVTATFSNCYLSLDGMTTNGGISLTNLTIKGTPSVAGTAWNATATFGFSKMTINTPSGNYLVNGALTYTGNTQNGVAISVSLSGSSLTVQKTGGPTLTLANFNFKGNVDNNTMAFSEYGSGQVTDSALKGYVNFTIPSATPFAGNVGQYPSSGAMTVTGANKSSVKLTAIDSTKVQLQVDSNGDGVVDHTFTEPWSSLSP